jgi:transglutaminase-like putative cysteine protease
MRRFVRALTLAALLSAGAFVGIVPSGAQTVPSFTLPMTKIGTAALIHPTSASTYYGSGTTATDGLAGITEVTTPIAPEITELARALKNNPDLIYQYVRNNIETEWMYGLQKGALGTLIDKAGTPFDQADLMVKLLRLAGLTANYQIGTITLTGAQFTAWTNIADSNAACQMLASGGIPASINGSSASMICGRGAGSSISSVTMSHIWVQVTIPDSSCTSHVCLFDPSYKPHNWMRAISLPTLASFT